MGLYKAKEVWTGTLASSIPDATTTSFTLTSSSGLTNGETYVFTIDRVDVNGTKTPNKKEVIIGTASGSNVIDCIRGVEGTAQAHSAGAIVEILFTAKHWNDFIESFKAQHREDGTHSKIQGLDNNQAITQKDSAGTERSIIKLNASNILEIGDSNLAGQQFNTPLVNNTAIKQKDSDGAERSIAKVNASNVLEIGDSNLAGQQFNTPLVNNTAIKQKDSNGTARDILKLNSSNDLEIGGSGINKLIFNTPFDGWIAANETWTYASSTSFTVSGNVTGKYQKGDKIKLTQSSTVKYFYIINVSYSNLNTTITITGGNTYSLANATITDNYYSKAENPQGFPTSFSYTPTAIGLTNPVYGAQKGRFRIIGDRCILTVFLGISSWSAQSGYINVTLPITSKTMYGVEWYGVGFYYRAGGSSVDGATTVRVKDNSNVIFFIKNTDAADYCYWEASAAVSLGAQVEYEF